MTEVRWEMMFPDQLEQRFAECPLLYLTYGLCEPHGPQNTVGLDALKAHGIAVLAAQAHGGIVAPPDYWHIHEVGHFARWGHAEIGQARTWLTSLPPRRHFQNVLYQVRAADVLGFHAVILLTGHYGPNWRDLKSLAVLIQPKVGARLCAIPDFEANQPGFDGSTGDHAGKVETSLLWALHPECVDMGRLHLADEAGHRFAMGPDAATADRRTGERMVADEVNWLGTKGRELLAEYDSLQPEVRLRTYAQVESLWQGVVEPEFSSFHSLRESAEDEPDLDEVPPGSQWYDNRDPRV